MFLTGKEKAAVAAVITFVIGLANVIVPFVTDATVLHWITIGLAVVGFVGTTVGVYQVTNSATGEHATGAVTVDTSLDTDAASPAPVAAPAAPVESADVTDANATGTQTPTAL